VTSLALVLLLIAAPPAEPSATDDPSVDVDAAERDVAQVDDRDPAPTPDPSPDSLPAPTLAPTATRTPPPPIDEELTKPITGIELMGSFVRGMLMLCVVLFIAWLTLSKGLGKLVEKASAGKRMKVVERVALDARRTLFLVEIDGKQLIFGGGDLVKLHDVSAASDPHHAFAQVLHTTTKAPPQTQSAITPPAASTTTTTETT